MATIETAEVATTGYLIKMTTNEASVVFRALAVFRSQTPVGSYDRIVVDSILKAPSPAASGETPWVPEVGDRVRVVSTRGVNPEIEGTVGTLTRDDGPDAPPRYRVLLAGGDTKWVYDVARP